MADLPELRASDADREATAERLRDAAGDGQLSFAELDERLHEAYAARTRAELVPLTADLQAPGAGAVAATRPDGAGYTVRRGEGGARWLIAVMGGCTRRGRWRLGASCTSVNFMGGSELDLNDVELAADHVTLRVVSIMGGAEIRVPDGMAVEVSDFAFMGGNDVKLGEAPVGRPGPVLHLRLFTLMGGTDVKRGRKRTKEERRAAQDARRGHLGH